MNQSPPPTRSQGLNIVQIISILGFAGCITGTFLPWAQAGDGEIYSKAGTDTLGVVAVPLAALGALMVFNNSSAKSIVYAAVCAAAALGVGIFGIIEVRQGIGQLGLGKDLLELLDLEVKVGNGLYILIGSAAVALVASLLHAAIRRG